MIISKYTYEVRVVKSGKFTLLGNECSVRNGRIKQLGIKRFSGPTNHTCPTSKYTRVEEQRSSTKRFGIDVLRNLQ